MLAEFADDRRTVTGLSFRLAPFRALNGERARGQIRTPSATPSKVVPGQPGRRRMTVLSYEESLTMPRAVPRNLAVAAASLLLVACSGVSPGTTQQPEPGGSSSGGASSGSGGMTGSSGGVDDGGASSGAQPDDDGGEQGDASGSMRDASTRDAAARDASAGDAGIVPTGDAGDALAAARAQCVQIINMDRATLSPASPPLVEDTAEEACVDGQAQADYKANTAHSAFGKCKESAQDECPNWPGPPSTIMTKCLAQMWAEGPPAQGQDNHWLNMSNAKYKKVACGFYQTPTGKWWATQDFY
jgi:hypothetical protein